MRSSEVPVRILPFAPFGAPPPLIFLEANAFVQWLAKTRAQKNASRERGCSCPLLSYRGAPDMRQSERLGQAGFAQHCNGGVSALLPPLPLAGEGWGEGQCALNGLQNAFAIRHHLVVQKRTTRHPSALRNRSRRTSVLLSACCPPSSSTTRRCSIEAKSAMKGPIGTCRRNFTPPNRRSRSNRHMIRSASVASRRRTRARSRFCPSRMFSLTGPLRGPSPRPLRGHPLPQAGEGVKGPHLVFSKISRPISMRRISLVPAPIS